ncbi:MAG: non-homologous end-joining DNA ligase [Longimicrobiales bacterium]|nr:non-homologous end-joining DNA ligase [Longimicrobiales bacterium]
MTDPREILGAEAAGALSEEGFPDWLDPMLATLTDDPFSDPGWIYERKLDGVRVLAFKDGDRVRLYSRNRKDQNIRYPELVEALEGLDGSFVVDGEVVAFEGAVTSFSKLQDRSQIQDAEEARRSDVDVYYYLFDVMHLDGWDVTGVGLRHRKHLLRQALEYRDPIRFATHRNEDGEALLEEACRKGWEGLIAKDASSAYVHSRSRKWLKFKCVNRQELVIGGFTEPEGERIGFGALLVGYYEDGDLVYAGKVGTGYDDAMLRRLRDRMDELERETQPFDEPGDISEKGAHWITPELVGEVGFTEWTDDGKLRHPRFLGLREDKDPEEVVRERPVETG